MCSFVCITLKHHFCIWLYFLLYCCMFLCVLIWNADSMPDHNVFVCVFLCVLLCNTPFYSSHHLFMCVFGVYILFNISDIVPSRLDFMPSVVSGIPHTRLTSMIDSASGYPLLLYLFFFFCSYGYFWIEVCYFPCPP